MELKIIKHRKFLWCLFGIRIKHIIAKQLINTSSLFVVLFEQLKAKKNRELLHGFCSCIISFLIVLFSFEVNQYHPNNSEKQHHTSNQ